MQTNQLDEPSQVQHKLGSKLNPVFIQTEDDFKGKLKTGWWCTFYCKNCGKLVVFNKKTSEHPLLCKSCGIKVTNLERYGCENTFQYESFKKKSRETCLRKYGHEIFAKSEEYIEKTKKTNLERYGVEWSSKLDICKEKVIKTCNKKYGVDYAMQLDEVQDKRKSTNIEKYGTEEAIASTQVKEKIKNTLLSKYGVDNPFKSQEIQKQIKETFIEKYGVDNASKAPEIKKKIKESIISRYGRYVNIRPFSFKFGDLTFDSYWELCFYVYHIDNGLQITREPEPIKYVFNDEEHLYYPDFEVCGQLYEIKGDQFFKDDGTMQNPYDHTKDALFEAKHQCALQNKVVFIRKNEIKPYINYVESKYGKNFKEEHKV